MDPLHPITEPHDHGMLDVGDGHRIHWEVSGDPNGRPAVVLHGGPGSGAAARHRRLFDPNRWRIVQFDQRNCGQSTPHAGEPVVDLSTNTTTHLIEDIEALRTHLGVDRWLVWGGSWGTTLGLAYAQAHVDRVDALVLGSVVTTSRAEVDWVTRSMGRVFPEAWQRFVGFLPDADRAGDLAEAYRRQLMHPDPAVHQSAALAWCDWEDTHVSLATGHRPDLRDAEPSFRLCFARLVTHYWANAGFLPAGRLLRDAPLLADTPTFLAHGRGDISSPTDVPVAIADAIPGAQLHIHEGEGHGGPALSAWMAEVIDGLASAQR